MGRSRCQSAWGTCYGVGARAGCALSPARGLDVAGMEKSGWHRVFWVGLLALLVGAGRPVFAVTPLERDLKKISRYMNDGFCEDALNLAKELVKSKEGAESFDVRFSMVQAYYCLHDVASTIDTAAAMRQELTLDPGQELSLNTFYRTKIESKFGELRLVLPGGKTGTVEVEINKVGELDDPSLEPFYVFVKQRLDAGVQVPVTLYLPLGTYEIDQVERTLEDFRGITFVIGKEKLSKWKRAQVGDGQLVGFGFIDFTGFGGLEHTQPGDESQDIVSSERLSFSSTPYLEVSSTHSMRLGTMGIVGVRVDGRMRPAMDALGGVKTTETGRLIPAYYSAAMSIHLAIPGPKGLIVNTGVGVRGSYIEYVQYLANISIPPEASGGQEPLVVPAGIDLGAAGIGPELTVGTGWAFRMGDSGIQLGIELQSGITVLSPLKQTGTVVYAGGPEEYEYELINEGVLWGPHVGVMLFARSPFF